MDSEVVAPVGRSFCRKTAVIHVCHYTDVSTCSLSKDERKGRMCEGIYVHEVLRVHRSNI